jgi:hypothetical protein
MSGIIYTPPPGIAGSVIADSGTYTAPAFAGSVLQIDHTLGVIPTAVTVLPNNFGALSLFVNPFIVTVSVNKIFIDFGALVAVPNPIQIMWGVFKT